jgi:hypothetical protein
MGNGKRTSHVSTWLILSLILLAVVACTQAVGEATLAPEPMPTPGIDAPAGAIGHGMPYLTSSAATPTSVCHLPGYAGRRLQVKCLRDLACTTSMPNLA